MRYLQKSSLLEDVYAYNDFSHTGQNPGVVPKEKVTPDMRKALLVSEHNGHMFPTKTFDPWAKRQEHALRHARVQNDARADGQHVGCFGWCMFDYPTHKDFGSGDRVCYHGVMDAFRNPKLAAALYASQQDETPVLECGTPMDIGDYPGGDLGKIFVFTNADEVELYKNGVFVKSFRSEGWQGLEHGPVEIDDTIGCLLESVEGFPQRQARLVRDLLDAIRIHGQANLPLETKAKALILMKEYGMTVEDVAALYAKYVGNWGGEATVWRFDGKRGGELIASRTLCPGNDLHLEVKVSRTTLCEGDRYDMAALRIRVLDENGNLAPYAQLPLQLTAHGAVSLVGEKLVVAEGGSTGCYVKTHGRAGKGSLTIQSSQAGTVTVEFEVKKA